MEKFVKLGGWCAEHPLQTTACAIIGVGVGLSIANHVKTELEIVKNRRATKKGEVTNPIYAEYADIIKEAYAARENSNER